MVQLELIVSNKYFIKPKYASYNLHKAKKAKNDEFYTRYEDIAEELPHYKEYLADKVIYCNCDDYRWSNFVKYFKDNFKEYKLKKLISLSFWKHYEYDGVNEVIKDVSRNEGDFHSKYSQELLKQADVVITNPPFSLFREYVAQLIEYKKKFLILGSMNAITYKGIFLLFKNNLIWFGWNKPKEFILREE